MIFDREATDTIVGHILTSEYQQYLHDQSRQKGLTHRIPDQLIIEDKTYV